MSWPTHEWSANKKLRIWLDYFRFARQPTTIADWTLPNLPVNTNVRLVCVHPYGAFGMYPPV